MAAYQAKTKVEPIGIDAFLAQVEPPERQADARRLAAIFAEVTGFAPAIWATMVGFGRYEYTYESGHSGAALAVGFAPRKAELVLYGLGEAPGAGFDQLGKHRRGKSCTYVKRLDGLDEAVLRKMIRAGLDDLAARWPVTPS